MRALILLILVPLAVGCGAKESGLAESDEAMKDAGSSRMEARQEGPKGPIYLGSGSFDYVHDRGEFVTTSNSMDLPGGEMRGRFIGRTTYIGWMLLGKLRWTKDEDEPVESEPTLWERFTPGPGGPNPDQLLGVLTKASKQLETLGTDMVRGVPARHYQAHIDKKKLPDNVSYQTGDLVIDAWIDEDGLVRRIRIPEPFEGQEDEVTVVEFFDFGVEVDVEAPSADAIITQDEFSKLAKKECAQMRRKGEAPEDSFVCAIGGFGGSDHESTETVPQAETER